MYLEVITCCTLEHPALLSIYGVSSDFGPMSLILPWAPHGNVRDCWQYLHELSYDPIPDAMGLATGLTRLNMLHLTIIDVYHEWVRCILCFVHPADLASKTR
jgi:hypothetical protein